MEGLLLAVMENEKFLLVGAQLIARSN